METSHTNEARDYWIALVTIGVQQGGVYFEVPDTALTDSVAADLAQTLHLSVEAVRNHYVFTHKTNGKAV